MEKGKGRPKGFVMSEYSKKMISESKTGQSQSQETKDKISKSLKDYFETEIGKNQRELYKEVSSNFWNSYSGFLTKKIMSKGLKKQWVACKKMHS